MGCRRLAARRCHSIAMLRPARWRSASRSRPRQREAGRGPAATMRRSRCGGDITAETLPSPRARPSPARERRPRNLGSDELDGLETHSHRTSPARAPTEERARASQRALKLRQGAQRRMLHQEWCMTPPSASPATQAALVRSDRDDVDGCAPARATRGGLRAPNGGRASTAAPVRCSRRGRMPRALRAPPRREALEPLHVGAMDLGDAIVVLDDENADHRATAASDGGMLETAPPSLLTQSPRRAAAPPGAPARDQDPEWTSGLRGRSSSKISSPSAEPTPGPESRTRTPTPSGPAWTATSTQPGVGPFATASTASSNICSASRLRIRSVRGQTCLAGEPSSTPLVGDRRLRRERRERRVAIFSWTRSSVPPTPAPSRAMKLIVVGAPSSTTATGRSLFENSCACHAVQIAGDVRQLVLVPQFVVVIP